MRPCRKVCIKVFVYWIGEEGQLEDEFIKALILRIEYIKRTIVVREQHLENVKEFVYLGSFVNLG